MRLGAKQLWKLFGIVEVAIKPQGGEGAEVVDLQTGNTNHVR